MAATNLPFDNLYRHGFARVAVCLPRQHLAEPDRNLEATIALWARAERAHARLALFPELGLCGYSLDDLLQQDALLDGCLRALSALVAESKRRSAAVIVGLPLRADDKLWNCAAVIARGRLCGLVPKTYLPNYREYYEKRYFVPAAAARQRTLRVLEHEVPFGVDLIFRAPAIPGFDFAVEICEDLWAPVPPSTWAALGGALVLCNPSASNVTVDKANYRRLLVQAQSGRCLAAYLYAGAGAGESTTDLAWDGHGMVCENGELLLESRRFEAVDSLLLADLDLDRLRQERARMSSFQDAVTGEAKRLEGLRAVAVEITPPAGVVPLRRVVPRFPYVPAEERSLDERCSEAYHIQVHGLEQRLRQTGIEKVAIGVSGGLDSTQALIVAARALDRLGLPRANVLGYTMPGFATSERTRRNAHELMSALGVSAHEIDIKPSCLQMLHDLDHPYARGEPVYDVTFENVQAGERTSHLFRLANRHGALVVGTGDLSELALGWTTYGVGDHMSHYGVNGSVPKTLIQHLLRWEIKTRVLGDPAGATLQSILDTEITPELVPAAPGRGGQRSEDVVGPYELQDFHLYYLTRFGFRPSKVAFLCHHAWRDRSRGAWPVTVPSDQRRQYRLAEIVHWLSVFLYRFFELSQYKRSALPNGPKVGSGGSLSPRGDWRAPSDARATEWLAELRANVPATSVTTMTKVTRLAARAARASARTAPRSRALRPEPAPATTPSARSRSRGASRARRSARVPRPRAR